MIEEDPIVDTCCDCLDRSPNNNNNNNNQNKTVDDHEKKML